MNTCPNCAAAAANELVTVCTACPAVTVAGSTINLTALAAAVAIAGLTYLAIHAIRRIARPTPRIAAG